MTKGVPVTSSYRSRRHEVHEALNGALANRQSYFGFLMGLLATLAIVGIGFAYLAARTDLLAF